MLFARSVIKWGSADFRKNMESLPVLISRINGKANAEDFSNKLNNSGFRSHVQVVKL